MFNLLKNRQSAIAASVMTARIVFTMLASTTAHAVVSPFSANYNFSFDKYKGLATRKLSQVGNQWQYNMNANVGGLASANQSATFINQSGVIVPLNSSTQYKIFGTGRATNLTFDHQKHLYISNYKGTNKTIAMPQIAFDDLSLEIQIREDLKAGRFRGNYVLAGRNGVDTVPFVKTALMKVTVPAGTFDVIRVDRVHEDKDRKTSFWLAPKLDYLPVQVIQNDEGKTLQMQLTKVN